DVIETALVEVARLVDVEDLAIEVARGHEVPAPQRRLDLREHVVEVLLEAGAGQEVEHAAREEEGDHLARRERVRLPAGRGHEAPNLALARQLLVERLAGAQ